MKTNLLLLLLAFALSATFCFAQEAVKPNVTKNFTLKDEESKIFTLNLKPDDFAEINIGGGEDYYITYKITSPSGLDLLKYAPQVDNSFSFIARETGAYQVQVTLEKSETPAGTQKFTIGYADKFALPKAAKVLDSRKINGYDVKIYEGGEESDFTYLVIEKGGKLKYVAKSTKGVGGLSFPDTANAEDDKTTKSSAQLFKTTADKTGDGAPDVVVENYSGGAHCCFSTYFFELGDQFKLVPALDTGDASTLAIGKLPNGSLKLATGDSTFAYWNTSFAGSPIPEVILSFRDGAFRADAKLMAKPAPAPAKLKANAAAARRKISLAPYTGDTNDNTFDEAFWGEMLDLIYSGHEDLAYQYLDMVWNPKKKGKELFKKDFIAQLNRSEFYQDYLTGK